MEPLQGVLVVEMTIAVQGPAAGVYLRDMGAEVIKVEPPLGDPSRYGRARDNPLPEGTVGPQFVACNRGKRSVCIDLTTELGLRAIHALLARADVFFSNYREPALRALGLDFASLHARYPDLIHATVNGFGPAGADADKAMLDGVAIARGGLASVTGAHGCGPALPGAIVADTAGAMQLALGIVTALCAKARGAPGQQVQTSALGAQLWLQQWELTHCSMTGAQLAPAGPHHPNIRGPYGVYRTSDGGAIMLAQTMTGDAWDAICVFGDDPELALDPRVRTPGQRLGEGMTDADSDAIRARLAAVFARRTAAEWDTFLRGQPEAIWERVRSHAEVLSDPQNLVNGYLTEVEIDGVGRRATVGNLIGFSATPATPKGAAPALGEGNSDVLGRLGFSAAEIDALNARAETVRTEAIAEMQATLAQAARERAEGPPGAVTADRRTTI